MSPHRRSVDPDEFCIDHNIDRAAIAALLDDLQVHERVVQQRVRAIEDCTGIPADDLLAMRYKWARLCADDLIEESIWQHLTCEKERAIE